MSSLTINDIHMYHLKNLQNEAAKQSNFSGRNESISLFVLTTDFRVLVHRRSHKLRNYPGCWYVPGGHAEGDESIIDTAKRELKEEAGLDLTNIPDDSFIQFNVEKDREKEFYCYYVFVSPDTVFNGPEKGSKWEVGKDTTQWVKLKDIANFVRNKTYNKVTLSQTVLINRFNYLAMTLLLEGYNVMM